ncbi:MAG: hypothetical protein ACXW3C_12165 [Pyrinomonadaceae bacterium]
MLKCQVCGSEIPDTVEKCFTCGFNAGPPNVRAAVADVLALDARYRAAIAKASSVGSLSVLERFEHTVKDTCAVINADLRFLHYFVTGGKELYANYEGAVAGGIRKPAEFYNDLKRRGVGGTLFGGYAGEIIYAALSLDGSGPKSYGPYAIKLREIAVINRATVLENNGYKFTRKHSLGPGDPLPAGHLASWPNRQKLAVAKLAEYITPTTTNEEFARLLLTSTGDRATDEFMEVHLYGTFDLNAVESVKGSSKLNSRDDRALLRIVKAHLSKAGKLWVEE